MQARMSCLLGWVLCAGLIAAMAAPAAASGPMFDGMVLVDEINCGDPADPHAVSQSPSGASQIQTILGRPCRVLPPASGAKYFAYRIGAGLIQPGKAYILTVDYPEDQPRSIFVTNAGAMTTDGFRTGNTLGNAFGAPYVMQDRESLSLPLSGQWETWQQFFHLHERFAGVKEPRGAATLPDSPVTGFLVTVFQFKQSDDPTSVGAAVSHIRLYEAPEAATYTQQLNLPPAGLPQRHLFWREEMADIPAVDGSSASTRVVTDRVDWYVCKARLLKFLGMNTFSKDLLEFGSNQNWDSTPYGGHDWVYMGSTPWMWDSIVDVMGSYGLNVLPYYEYSGSKGTYGLGWERHARPLTDTNAALDYTHISWTETANADVTWPATLPDLEKMLDCTIVLQKDRANFIGAWLRPRSSQMPVSFSDDALARFAAEANGGVAVTRAELVPKGALYVDYMNWWYGVRRQFLRDLRDYLRAAIGKDDAAILYTWDPAEGGCVYPDWGRPNVLTDDVATWTALGKTAKEWSEAVAEHYHFKAQTLPPLTWEITSGSGKMWEWEHAVPKPDVENYHDGEGVMMTHTFNAAYTVSDPYSFEQFRTAGGLAIIRHYMLNENAPDTKENGIVGYFVANTNLAGPFTMLGEARAMAYGDPRYIGYLSGDSYNRGFPQYVRNFNAAFLALPALPSAVLEGAANNADVVVRSIDAGDHGTYLAVVNVGFLDADNVTVTLPFAANVTNAATGEPLAEDVLEINLSLYPCQLMSLHLEPSIHLPPPNTAPAAADITLETLQGEVTDIALAGSDAETPAAGLVYVITSQPAHGWVELLPGGVARYVPAVSGSGSKYAGVETFQYTATDTDIAPLTSAPATVTLNLLRNDRFGARAQSPEDLPAYIMIRGPGSGTIQRDANPAPGDPDILRVVLQGTTMESTLIVQGRDGLTIGEIIVEKTGPADGSLAGIDAARADVLGNIDAHDGTLGTVTLRNLSDGVLMAGAGPAGWAMNLRLACVRNYSIDSATPIASLACSEWLDDDESADLIEAPSLARLTTLAKRANARRGVAGSDGDFQADLELTGSFGGGSIAGDLFDATWRIAGCGSLTVRREMNGARILSTGDIAAVTAGGMVDSDIYAGVADGVTGLPDPLTDIYTLPRPAPVGRPGRARALVDQGADLQFAATIGAVAIRGLTREGRWYIHNFANSNIAAYRVGTISLRNADLEAAGQFGVAAHVGGQITYTDRDKTKSCAWPSPLGGRAACGTALTVNLAMLGVDSFVPQELVLTDAVGDGNYAFSDISNVYVRVLGDWVYLGIRTAEPVDQPGASQLVFQVALDIARDYQTLLSQEDSVSDCIVNYDRDRDAVTVWFGGGLWNPENWADVPASEAYAIVTPEGVVMCVPLEILGSFGPYQYVKAFDSSIWQDWANTDRLMDVAAGK